MTSQVKPANPEMTPASQKSDSGLSIVWLIVAGLVLLMPVLAMHYYSFEFPFVVEPGRPILEFVVASVIASVVGLIALWCGLKVQPSLRWLVPAIILFAIGYRALFVFSLPVLEIDYYRYIWDGEVSNLGVSPYKYSPQTALNSADSKDRDLQRIFKAIEQDPELKTIASRIHFEGYTSIYPPVSQFVFQMAAMVTPPGTPPKTQVIWMKTVLVLFDLGTICFILWMLKLTARHPAWAIAYAWNPLVLKEIANGGHLDSIAIFCMTGGVAFLLLAFGSGGDKKLKEDEQNVTSADRWKSVAAIFCAAIFFALGIGAKLFPVVVVPAILVALARRSFTDAVLFAVVCGLATFILMQPMTGVERPVAKKDVQGDKEGLSSFLTHWRMNDAIFSFVYQNVEYDWGEVDGLPRQAPWYVVVPNDRRIEWCRNMSKIRLANGNPAFFVARLVTVGMFALFYLFMLPKFWRSDTGGLLAANLFLLMAVFFYLQPTQNPWYWLWAMPLICFAKNRGWMIVSLVLFVYYLRFYFREQTDSITFGGIKYAPVDFFDHNIVWFEFALVVFCVVGAWLFQRFRTAPDDSAAV